MSLLTAGEGEGRRACPWPVLTSCQTPDRQAPKRTYPFSFLWNRIRALNSPCALYHLVSIPWNPRTVRPPGPSQPSPHSHAHTPPTARSLPALRDMSRCSGQPFGSSEGPFLCGAQSVPPAAPTGAAGLCTMLSPELQGPLLPSVPRRCLKGSVQSLPKAAQGCVNRSMGARGVKQ